MHLAQSPTTGISCALAKCYLVPVKNGLYCHVVTLLHYFILILVQNNICLI